LDFRPVPPFKKVHLLAEKGTPSGRGDVFVTRPKVKVILWDFLTKLAFGH
jgi:hypothetical protein